MNRKSSVDDIRRRFDGDVERFSNLQTGQSATIDAPLMLDLVAEAAAATTPHARAVLDVGCGAGNYTLKLLERLPNLDATLLDLSRPMLDRAVQRVSAATRGNVVAVQGDVREADLPEGGFDVILAAAVLHHLRTDAEWKAVFSKFHGCLRAGGSLWIADLVDHENPAVQAAMWRKYGEYLAGFKGEAYREEVFAYVAREDTPRSLAYQVELLRKCGFARIEVLHKNNCFAAFGGMRSRRKVEREGGTL
jgi:tRNA (cmo5U34)-methyltransferase